MTSTTMDHATIGETAAHSVQFYEEDAFLLDTLIRFVGTGLEVGQPALLIASAERLEGFENSCRTHGIDLDRARERGQLVTLDAHEELERFMIDGAPDEALFLERFGSSIDGLSGSGPVLRAFGEMVAILWAEGKQEAAVRVEALWNVLARDRQFSLLCAYPMKMFRAREEQEAFLAVLGEHSHVLPAESYSALLDPGERLRTITELQQKAEALENEAVKRAEAERALRLRCEELELQHRNKDEFLAMLGHELRGPIATIRNAVSIARVGDEHSEQALEIAARQIDRMVGLINDLLDVALVSRGRITIDKDVVHVRDVLEEALGATRALFEARNHTIETSLPTSEIFIAGSSLRLYEIIVNLLENAAKYTERGGQIAVDLERDGDQAVLCVRDNGVGMHPDLLAQVFDLFMQGPRPLDRGQGGLGLGMTIAKRLVELHDGTIAATSDGPGKGSAFTVRLPVLDANRCGDHEARGNQRDASSDRARVLVVEDDVEQAETLCMLLEAIGCETRTVNDGLQAPAVARSWRPDLALVDIGLPGIDGYEVAKRIRADADLATIKLAAVTGYSGDKHHQKAIAAGFDRDITKPITIEDLRALLPDHKVAKGI